MYHFFSFLIFSFSRELILEDELGLFEKRNGILALVILGKSLRRDIRGVNLLVLNEIGDELVNMLKQVFSMIFIC